MICPEPSLNLGHMGCSHGLVHDYSTRGSPHRCPGGGIPIGAVLANARGTVVATGRNRRLQEGTCVMYAEINCLLNAGQKLSSFRGMTMYSTLIPCNMCAGAIVHSGIIKMVYGEPRNLPEDNGREHLVRSSPWSDME